MVSEFQIGASIYICIFIRLPENNLCTVVLIFIKCRLGMNSNISEIDRSVVNTDIKDLSSIQPVNELSPVILLL